MHFFETLYAQEHKLYHLNYHQKRLERTFKAFFTTKAPSLHTLPAPPDGGCYRCRVVYAQSIETVQYLPYTPKKAKKLILVSQDFNYPYKAVDRSAIDKAKLTFSDCDDLIFVKEGLITDTSIANIAILEKGIWLTPRLPMLEGTTRARLLDEKKLQTADITPKRLLQAQKIALMNALSGFYELTEAKILSSLKG